MHQVLGSRLRVNLGAARAACGWSQSELSRRSGVPQSQISKLEQGVVHDPAVSTAASLARALGIGLDVLNFGSVDDLIEQVRANATRHGADPSEIYDVTYAMAKLRQLGSRAFADDVSRWMQSGANLVISGLTGSGHTDVFRHLCALIGHEDRVAVIDENAGQYLDHPKAVVVSVPGEPVSSHIRRAAALRPDRLIIGETPDEAVSDLLDVMALDSLRGVVASVSASSASAALERLKRGWFTKGDYDSETDLARTRKLAAVDVMIHVAAFGGDPRITDVVQPLPTVVGSPHLHSIYHGVKLGRANTPVLVGRRGPFAAIEAS